MRIIAFFCFCLLFACKSSQSNNTQDAVLLLEMQKTACFGTCPVYEVAIYSNGYVQFEGQEHVPYKGDTSFYFSPEKKTEFINRLEKVNLKRFKDRYYAGITDLPTTYLTYYAGEDVKKIMNYHGAPESLNGFQDTVQEMIFSSLR